jgi:hypothetical protein
MIRPWSCLLLPALLAAAPTPKNLSPEGTVGRQIELFNAHDLEGFLTLFSEDLEVAELPAGTSVPYGKTKLREVSAERFKGNPDLHASADAQMVSGDFVVQKEIIKGRTGKKDSLKTVVIYQVKAGKIVRMWGLRD